MRSAQFQVKIIFIFFLFLSSFSFRRLKSETSKKEHSTLNWVIHEIIEKKNEMWNFRASYDRAESRSSKHVC